MSDETKKMILINLVCAEVYELFREAETYDDSLQILKSHYLKVLNVVFARHLLTLSRESNRLKYRSGSGSRNLIFNGSVPVQSFSKIWVQVRFGFSCTKMYRLGFGSQT